MYSSAKVFSEATLCPWLAIIYNHVIIIHLILSYTSHTVEPGASSGRRIYIYYSLPTYMHTLPRTNCSSKKQAIMIDNVPVGWKLANSLLASQFSDNHWLSPSPYTR